MSFTVIWFTISGGIGQESFVTLSEAIAFDKACLDRGHTTSGVLGDGDNWLSDE